MPSAEQRLRELGITLPAPPEPFGTYAEAVQSGNLLFLTGGRKAARHFALDTDADEIARLVRGFVRGVI